MHHLIKRQRRSDKFRLRKHLLYDKLSVEYALLQFLVFSFFQHWHVSSQKFYEKTNMFLRRIFQALLKFNYVTKFYDLAMF